MRLSPLSALTLLLCSSAPYAAQAATVSGQMQIGLTLLPSCHAQTPSETLQCSPGVSYGQQLHPATAPAPFSTEEQLWLSDNGQALPQVDRTTPMQRLTLTF